MKKLSTQDEQGATAAEYGLMIALIAAVITGSVVLLGGETLGLYQRVCATGPFTC